MTVTPKLTKRWEWMPNAYAAWSRHDRETQNETRIEAVIDSAHQTQRCNRPPHVDVIRISESWRLQDCDQPGAGNDRVTMKAQQPDGDGFFCDGTMTISGDPEQNRDRSTCPRFLPHGTEDAELTSTDYLN